MAVFSPQVGWAVFLGLGKSYLLEVSLIYLSRSTKAPKRKLQANGPVTKKAKKKTSSSDSSEDSSEEEKAQGPPSKKAGKARLGVGD